MQQCPMGNQCPQDCWGCVFFVFEDCQHPDKDLYADGDTPYDVCADDDDSYCSDEQKLTSQLLMIVTDLHSRAHSFNALSETPYRELCQNAINILLKLSE